jgi:glycolate oxidase
VEAAPPAGYPFEAAAGLLNEVEGLTEAVEEQASAIAEACHECGAREVRTAKDAAERDLLWKGRKNAFGAIGRVSPTYYVQDGVVPRTQIASTLEAIDRIGKKYGIAISNVFHAGDGNMHPILPFDPRSSDGLERARKAGEEILEYCISVGGSITGEHGVGIEKMELMAHLFPEETLDTMKDLKAVFDPSCSLNPGKVLPTGKGCLEIRQPPNTIL